MLYRVFAPPARLAPYVRFFWALEGDVVPGEEFTHRSVADGSVEMVFHYRGAFSELTAAGETAASTRANIQAQSTGYRRFVGRESFGIFGVYLFPFAIPRLFSLPASELTDISPDLEDVLGIEAARLDEMIGLAQDNEKRVRIASQFLVGKLDSGSWDVFPVNHAVKRIMDAKGAVDVLSLARDLTLSRRQFERRFKEVAGLSPKLYSRVIRFQAATQFKVSGFTDLASIAYECGYYDQSHFTNDFRRFSGYTPKQYFLSDAEGTQYLDA
jgi:AraC-like DNA-binding protein